MKPTRTYIALIVLFGLTLWVHADQFRAKKALNLEGARRIIAGAQAEAARLNAPGAVIAVVDDGGNLMALERLDNTFPAGSLISIGKARTSALFQRPTRVFEEIIRNGRTPMVALNDFTPLQGGVPVLLDGQIVGAVGVSGAASAAQDEEIALAGAAALTMDGTPPPAVQHFDSGQVKEAFGKGAVLVGAGEGRNYMIHASRRDVPGMAEVHEKDTDLIYVLEGTATFVTGGEMIDPRTIEAYEVRGSGIAHGKSLHLTPGAVIVVPSGTPHWFQEVSNPFTYYVVKVR